MGEAGKQNGKPAAEKRWRGRRRDRNGIRGVADIVGYTIGRRTHWENRFCFFLLCRTPRTVLFSFPFFSEAVCNTLSSRGLISLILDIWNKKEYIRKINLI